MESEKISLKILPTIFFISLFFSLQSKVISLLKLKLKKIESMKAEIINFCVLYFLYFEDSVFAWKDFVQHAPYISSPNFSKAICCRLLNECILPYIYQKKPLYLSIWPIWSLQSTDISNINIQYLILIHYLIFCETFVKYSIFHILYLIFDTLRISYLFRSFALPHLVLWMSCALYFGYCLLHRI